MEQGDSKMLPVESARYNTLIFKLNPFSNNLIRFYSPRVILERNWPNVDKLFVQPVSGSYPTLRSRCISNRD